VAKPKKQPLGQTIGGIMFGFEQQVLRSSPPPEELVHHARPDASVAAGDGALLTIGLPEPLVRSSAAAWPTLDAEAADRRATDPADPEPPVRDAPEGAVPR
jgi:hypothetical protein